MDLPRPKTYRLLPKVISKDQVKLIMGVIKNIKHKAVVSLLYDCGLRRSEVCDLLQKDIDYSRNTLLVKGKGGKYRMLPIGKKTKELLQFYIKATAPKNICSMDKIHFVIL